MYLAVSELAVNGVIMRSEEGRKLPIYYVNMALLEVETRYSKAKKNMFGTSNSSQEVAPLLLVSFRGGPK